MASVRQVQPEPDEPFSLRDVIRAALNGTEPDPHKLAEQVAASIPFEHVREALKATLPDYIRKVGATSNPANRHIVRRTSRFDGVAEIRTEIALLRSTVCARGEWKFLGTCGIEDCLDLAAQRDDQAAKNTVWAERFRRAVKALRKHKVRTLRELPATVVEDIFDA